jgi:hypothetical protein
MCRRTVRIALFCFGALPAVLQAQEFRLFDREVQVHGCASQGYVLTSGNHWLTIITTGEGSAGFTDCFSVDAMPITRLRSWSGLGISSVVKVVLVAGKL